MAHRRCEDHRWWDNSTQLVLAQPDTTGACRVRDMALKLRAGRRRLSPENVIEIRRLYADGADRQDVADRFGIKKGTVYDIALRRSWRHI
jgi:DNA invertase Pin-like site-specific DNA recombinase